MRRAQFPITFPLSATYWQTLLVLAIFTVLAGESSAQLNNPYPTSERNKSIKYSVFDERPKHLDPAISYSEDEYTLITQIYEPVVQYHYLKRPYELVPLTATKVPDYKNFSKDGNLLPHNAASDQVASSVWTITIQEGILYQNHPCFAKDSSGAFIYHNVTEDDMKEVNTLFDLDQVGTRELTAEDYIYQIKRMADPRLRCPILTAILVPYIDGMKEYAAEVSKELARIRKEREDEAKQNGVLFFNREQDEKDNPIIIDYQSIPCRGLKVIDPFTYSITLTKQYPQFKYWLSMPFFSPIPWEANAFYSQGPMIGRNIIIDWYPVGTGAYQFESYDPNKRIVLIKNENYRGEPYPSEGEPGDREAGLLEDAGKPMPFTKRVIFSREIETAPLFTKFKQGYYDASGIPSENFTSVMSFADGQGLLSSELKKRGIRLTKALDPSVTYLGFNMLDPKLGGLDEKQQKLRQAISISVNWAEFLQIFRQGRGVQAQGPIPPAIFGNRTGREGINPYIFDWDEELNAPKRKSLKHAKQLLAEAGYPNGISEVDKTPLVIYFDLIANPGNASLKDWLKKQFKQLGIRMEVRETDYNRFREKVHNGTHQMFIWGWNADYPDPENFLFLLYGPNSRTRFKGENAVNYDNPAFDKLFLQMNTMENSPERLEIIQDMLEIVRKDSPWDFGFHAETYALYHSWQSNIKRDKMLNNTLKYHRIDVDARNEYRDTYNRPKLIQAAATILAVLAFFIPGLFMAFKKGRR